MADRTVGRVLFWSNRRAFGRGGVVHVQRGTLQAPIFIGPNGNDDQSLTRVAAKLKTADEKALYALYRRYYVDVKLVRPGDLNQILTRDFVFKHRKGYRQPRAEWLDQVRTGIFRYAEDREEDADIKVKGDTALVVTRNQVHVHIYGSDDIWKLKLRFICRKDAGQWRIAEIQEGTYDY